MVSHPMTCPELVELITGYLEDELAPRTRSRFEAHLDGCEDCRVHLDQMRQTLKVLGHLPEETLSEPGKRALLRAFRDWKHQ